MSRSPRSVLGAGSLYTLATVAPILALLFVTPFVTHLLGAAEYGQVAVAISAYQLSSVVLGFGLPAMVTRDALLTDGGYGRASGYIVAGAALGASVGAIAAGTAAAWAPLVFPGVEPGVIALAICAGFGLSAVTLVQALMRAAERVGMFVAMAAVAALLPPLLGLSGALLMAPSAQVYAGGLAAGYLVAAAVALAAALRHARPRLDRRHFSTALLVGLPTVPHSLAVPALLAVALALVVRIGGLDVAGQLQVAVMLGTAVVTVLNAVNNLWTPMVFRESEHQRPLFLRVSTFYVSIVGIVLILGYVLIAPFAVPLVGGPVVTGTLATQASVIVAMSGMFHVLYLANIHLTFISQRTWPLALLTPLSAVIALSVGWVVSAALAWPMLLCFAAVWPVFYIVQAISAFVLAASGPFPPTDLRPSLPLLVIGAVGGGAALIFSEASPWRWAIVGACLAVLALVFLLFRRTR